jgi:dihydropteroate synthase
MIEISPETLLCGRYVLPVQGRPLVMGVLNVTPDSFSDGGRYLSLDLALSHAEQMMLEGVDIIDIGGESTRPGAPAVSLAEELDRVMPLLFALRDCGKPLSIDTRRPAVMREALAAGADMVNDVAGFRSEESLAAVSESDCALCIMHMLGEPQTMQAAPEYDNVVQQVGDFLLARVEQAQAAGIARRRLCLDPGFGFGKTLSHNLSLLSELAGLQQRLDLPLMVGLSRKSMLGTITGKPVEERMAASIAAALMAAMRGASIVRVHDVAATVDALSIWQAVRQHTPQYESAE